MSHVVSCPNCLSKFRVREDVGGSARFIKCAACAHVFVVTPDMLREGRSASDEKTSEFLPELSFIESGSDEKPPEKGEFTALATADTPPPPAEESKKRGRQAVLVIASREEAMPLAKFQTTFGRRNADVTLDDPDVSRQHAVIERYDEKYLLKDLESTNGTYLNGQRIAVDFLNDGDVIRMGKTVIRFQLR